MRALVTGAAGFIGSHLCDQLIKQGWTVIGVDDLSAGDLANVPDGVDMITTDLEDMRGGAYPDLDAVYHLAARIGPELVCSDRRAMLEDVKRTEVACEIAKRCKARLLVASSSEVYGTSAYEMCESDWLKVGPTALSRSAYAVAKLYGEHLAWAYGEAGVPVAIVRLFNVAGPRQREKNGCVLPKFINAVLTGAALEVHGGGEQIRCYAHVEDVVKVLIYALEKAESGEPQLLNIGGTRETTTLELAERVVKESEKYSVPEAKIEHIGYGDEDIGREGMVRRVANSAKLEELCDGMNVPNRLGEIVTDTMQYWADKLKIRKGSEQHVESRSVPTAAATADRDRDAEGGESPGGGDGEDRRVSGPHNDGGSGKSRSSRGTTGDSARAAAGSAGKA